jgi:hypothetical protein
VLPGSVVPPRQTFVGALVEEPTVTLTLTKLSTSTLPNPSGVDERITLTCDPSAQVRFTVALLNVFGWVVEVPSVELRTWVASKSFTKF